MKEYKITKEHCMNLITGVCSSCGGELEPIETVDNAGDPTHWPGCVACDKFDYGVDEKVFKAARLLVQKYRHITYDHLGYKIEGDEGYEYWLESQTSGACSDVYKFKKAFKEVGVEL